MFMTAAQRRARKGLPPLDRAAPQTDVEYWPSTKIPYSIDNVFSSSHRREILKQIAHITDRTGGCLKFVEKSWGDRDWIRFGKGGPGGSGCYTFIGYQPGKGAHPIFLEEDWCIYQAGVVAH
jgi:hypothetical protein